MASSYTTPTSSFSQKSPAINSNPDDESHSNSSLNQDLFHSFAETVPKRPRKTSSIIFQPITTNDTNTQYHADDYRHDEEEHLRSLRYDSNRLKQEKLLIFANIFRLLIIFILAPILYFLV